MGFTRHFSKELNFLLAKATGEINDSDLASHVKAINEVTNGLSNVKGLADCREITEMNLTTQDTMLSAQMEDNKPGSKIVILVPENNDLIYGMARSYQMFCEDYCEDVRVFQDYDEALFWLSNDDTHDKMALDNFIKTTNIAS